jgi:large subunit ribosomal protein L22
MKATLSNYRQSPRKVRLVADMVRGKSVTAARSALAFLPKKSSEAMLKLLNSAVANARAKGASPDALVISKISVDKGMVLRRFTPKARGRAATIRRTRSIISLELGNLASEKGAKKRTS